MQLHCIVENLSAHGTPLVEEFLDQPEHHHVFLHNTPTHASWLNQVELWFSIMERRLLRHGDAYFVTVAPNSASGAAPSTGDLSEAQVPPATGTPTPTRILPVFGVDQRAGLMKPFGSLLVALVTDQYGNGMAGQSVTFTAPITYGRFPGGATSVVTSDANGVATAEPLVAQLGLGMWSVNARFTGLTSPQDPIAYFALTNCLC